MGATPESQSDGIEIKARLAELHAQIRGMRADLQDTLELVDRLRATCVSIQARLTVAEQEYAMVLEQTSRL
jgi:arginine/ornithine N-succinyltransferase beta subunit